MMRIKRLSRQHVAAALMAAVAALGLFTGAANKLELIARPEPAHLKPTGYPQLIAVQPLPALPETNGEMCPVLTASLQEPGAPLRPISTNSDGARTKDAGRSPVR